MNSRSSNVISLMGLETPAAMATLCFTTSRPSDPLSSCWSKSMCQTLSAGPASVAGANRNLWATSASWTPLSGALAFALAAATVDAATDALTDGLAASLAEGAVVVVLDELGEAAGADAHAPSRMVEARSVAARACATRMWARLDGRIMAGSSIRDRGLQLKLPPAASMRAGRQARVVRLPTHAMR